MENLSLHIPYYVSSAPIGTIAKATNGIPYVGTVSMWNDAFIQRVPRFFTDAWDLDMRTALCIV